MTREREPTQLRPSQSGTIDAEAIEAMQREVEARARRWLLALAGRLATWLGLPLAGATGGYLAAHDSPTAREQPASGPNPPDPLDPTQCTPAEREQLLEAERRASRDARTALDVCRDAVERLDKEHP